MKDEIIGREAEKQLLRRLRQSAEPELLAVYGRRRVGKTFLIRNTFESEACYLEITGQHDAALDVQLGNFAAAFGRLFLGGHQLAAPGSWTEAFRTLAEQLERQPKRGRTVLFFDELPWLASRRSGFLAALEHFWNSWASRQQRLLLVVCGSAASWMLNKVIFHKGGLHNRVTAQLRLLPFSLADTEAYLRSRRVRLDRKQILELYLGLGGAPHYLRQIEPGLSAAQNIDRICFTKDGLLADEFTRLYSSLFSLPEQHSRVVETLARRHIGLTRKELLAKLDATSGGGATRVLDALEESGFITRSVPFGLRMNRALFRLSDEYSLFYLTWIRRAPRSAFGHTPTGYWQQQREGRAYPTWAGFAFERACEKHVAALKQGLGIGAVNTSESCWFHRAADRKQRGAQVDLLIDRSDGCINLCEMKHTAGKFVLDAGQARALRRKRDLFLEQTRTRKTVFVTLVTTHGARANRHTEELVDQQLTLDDLFRA